MAMWSTRQSVGNMRIKRSINNTVHLVCVMTIYLVLSPDSDLPPVQTSMFDDLDDSRIATSELMRKLR